MSTIEAQTSLSTPSLARLHVSRTAAPPTSTIVTVRINPTDDVFGYTFSSRTHESQHEQSLVDIQQPPPAYVAEDANLPPYARKAPEPLTLARYLFKYGFLFPPLWIMGGFILLSPLRAPSTPDGADPEAAWLPEKTEEERERIITQLRKVEVKWAMRCVWALLIFVLLGTVTGIAAWATFHT